MRDYIFVWIVITLLFGAICMYVGVCTGIPQGKQMYMDQNCDQFTRWQYDQGLQLAKCGVMSNKKEP